LLRTGADDAVVALRVLNAQFILDHPARGGNRLRKAARHLQQAIATADNITVRHRSGPPQQGQVLGGEHLWISRRFESC
jgi:hypothetical protein